MEAKSMQHWAHALVLLAVTLPYFTALGKSSLWDANEAFYAETPREMLITGDYLAPQFNFQPRTQKPPLTYWAVAASYKLFGINEFAVRFPGALAALGTVLFSYGLARLLFGPRAAIAAAVITAATPRIFILARRLPIDILLLFFLTGTLFFLLCSIRKDNPFTWAATYLFAALGFLTKGPVAAVIPAGAWLIWALRAGRLRISETRPLMGTAIFLAVALPWYVLVYRAHGWTYVSAFFLRDNVARFAAESMGPSRGLFYYASVLIIDFFPWSLFALAAIYLLWRNRKAEAPLKSLSFGLPLIWCGFTFLLFSLSKNKQEYYIAPMYPAASVLLAGILEKTLFGRADGSAARMRESASGLMQPPPRGAWLWPCAASSFLFLAFSILLLYALPPFMPSYSPVLHYAPSVVFGAGALLMGWHLVRLKAVRCFAVLAISLAAVYLMCPLFYLPAAEAFRPVKDFCRLIDAQFQGGDEAGFYGTALPSMVYYLRRPIFEETDPGRMLRRFESGRRVFCVLADKDYRYLTGRGDLILHVLDRRSRFAVRMRALLDSGSFAGEELLLVSNRPYSETGFREDRPIP